MRRIPDADRFRSDDYRTIIRIFGCNQEITDANILENTFSYDSTMLESGGFQIGTAMADEIKFTLDNSEGIYGKRFIDEEFEVYLAAIPTDGSREDAEWFLLGSYICKTIDETFTNKCAVVLQDRLTLMDKKASLTTGTLYSNLVSVCDGIVQLKLTSEEQTFLSDIPIYPENAEVNMTVRDFVRGCALLMWENAYITPDGFLSFRVCENSSLGFTPSDRFSSELGEEHFIGPIEILDDEGVLIYTAGTEIGQRITFTSSSSPIIPLIGGIENLALAYNDEVVPGRRIVDFGYYPLTMTLMQTWEVCPGDVITYADKNGNIFTSLVTSTASVLNGATSVTSDASETDETAKNTDSVRTLVQNLSTGISEAQDTADEAMPKYGSCDTPSTTAAKVVMNVTDFVLKQGARIAVLMSSANTVTSPTLNVNSTGAKPIVTADGGTLPLLTTNSTARGWLANSLVTFVYDGTRWRIDDNVAMTRINHILTEQIAGTNGWINLKDGTFNYGSGKLVWNGSQLTVDGKVTAETGNIGGWGITSNLLRKSTEKVQNGDQYDVYMQAPVNPTTSSRAFGVQKRTFTSGEAGDWSNVFYVDYSGKLYAKNVKIVGGSNGGWTIGTNAIYKDSTIDGVPYRTSLYAPDTPAPNHGAFSVRYGAGTTADPYTYPFIVRYNGKLEARNAVIEGDIVANSLTLGSGVTVPYSKVSGTPDLTVYVQKNGRIGSAPSEGATGFIVSSAGLLQASNAVIYGKLYSSEGKIGGWNIDSTKFSKDVTIDGVAHQVFMQAPSSPVAGNAAFAVRSGAGTSEDPYKYPFVVHYDGRIESTKGTIGGWTIGEDQLSSSAVLGGSTFTAFMKAISNKYSETAFGIKKDSGTAFSVDYAGNLFAARVKTLYLAPSNSSLIVMEGLQPYAYDLYMTSEEVRALDTKFGLTTGRPKLYDFLNNSQRILSIPYADGEVAQVPPGTTHRNLLTTALTLEANHRYVINYVVQWGANASGRRATAISIDGSSVGIIATDHRDAMSSGVTFCRGEYWIPASSSSRTLQITGWQDGTSGQTLPATVRYQLIDLGV